MLRQSHPAHFLVVLLGALSCVSPQASGVEIAPSRQLAGEQAPHAFVPYVASHSLSVPNDRITRILFSIHSSGFDALQYYENALAAVEKVRGEGDRTLIIAPQFFEQSAIPGTIPDGMLFWRVSPYRGSSRGAIGPGVQKVSLSAFDVMDNWLTVLVDPDLFPRLADVVLFGHSGGGQFVQRYALVGRFEAQGGITCRFVVSAPSSYAYPSAERLHRRTNRFVVPDRTTVARCPKYNDWGYGLSTPYAYFADVDADMIVGRYAERPVFYLCGSKDNNANDDTIGKSCGAMLQGRHRLERTQIFAAYMSHKYGRSISQTHKFAVVSGVGHYGRGTMTSPQGIRALFFPIP